MSNHLDLWNRFADIDPAFTKPITGKDYMGTSPNPHYVIQCLTEMFGPVGVGFGWEVEQDEFTPIGEEVLHWCRIRFWHTDRSNGFSAYGQTKALMKTKNGLRLDEDAPKKSLTDAVTKAASQIGIAANIFLGRWDDSKYVAEVNAVFRRRLDRLDNVAVDTAEADGRRAHTVQLGDDLFIDFPGKHHLYDFHRCVVRHAQAIDEVRLDVK